MKTIILNKIKINLWKCLGSSISNGMLKSIELSGFKSFATKNKLEFKAPFLRLLLNGSGKSNIAEAFRFVLGEQSIKSMRGKRRGPYIQWFQKYFTSE